MMARRVLLLVSQPVRLLVSTSPNQPANSVFLSQQTSTSQPKPAQKPTNEHAQFRAFLSHVTVECQDHLKHVLHYRLDRPILNGPPLLRRLSCRVRARQQEPALEDVVSALPLPANGHHNHPERYW